MDKNAERMAVYTAFKLSINQTGDGASFIPFMKMGYNESAPNVTKVGTLPTFTTHFLKMTI